MDRARRYFIPIITSWAVQDVVQGMIMTPGDVEDDDPNSSAGVFELPRNVAYDQLASATRSLGTSLSGSYPPVTAVTRRANGTPRMQRQRWRTVYGTVGIPLNNVSNARHVSIVLRDCSAALMLLTQAEYRHRDISLYNMYLVEEKVKEPSGALSDLEYAADWNSRTALHTIRTGTPIFMAAEKLLGRWLYLPDNDDDDESGTDELSDPFTRARTIFVPPSADQAPQVNMPKPKSWVTPLHDAEDLYWVAVYKLFYSVPAANPVPAPRQVEIRNLLFGFGPDTTINRKDFISRGRLSDPWKPEATDEEMVPAAFLPWWLSLKGVGKAIKKAHYPYQASWSNDVFYPNLQRTFLIYTKLVDAMPTDLEIAVYPDPKEDAARINKSIP
ncbi:hypothetical protein DACRYDRAFT_111400 [Dacryopinax primogenitus]|uniref:Fungal-type protein kinase domain-containing protein n=1 Tax=Dacryopinax primogenitus (strain DJM 731) TaxID=1858805 RepID=M5FNS7_DACPD|nr:uncharacterized protein DACRYDRAFT_111400 [Dacryopinax primogenitus]EJT97880.1 hypothetical protein DACRYDRAFT_111400 [Dacryopinax primogenitus]